MRKISLLLMLFFGIFVNSQLHRFIYDVEYKKDSTSELTTKENYILDIGKKDIMYYVHDFFIADSLISNNIPFPKDLKLNTSNIVVHKIGSNDFNEYDLMENTVLNLQSTDTQNWNLTSDRKQVKNLTLQKAITNWGGRNWIAWFTTDVPFSEGPYKFHGLPGLIIEIYDDKNNYRIELVKSVKIVLPTDNQFIKMTLQMSVPVSWDKYKSTKLKFYDSPISFIKNGIADTENEDLFLNDGTKVDRTNVRDINDRLRSNIKKYNNPIDISKSIKY